MCTFARSHSPTCWSKKIRHRQGRTTRTVFGFQPTTSTIQLQPNLWLSLPRLRPHLFSTLPNLYLSVKMAAEAVFRRGPAASSAWKYPSSTNKRSKTSQLLHFTIRASHSIDDKNRAYKQLGLFSKKKKIEDVIVRAEMLAPTALELEEARRIKQEEMIRDYDLWNDPDKSNEILVKLADSVKVVNALKDLKYKAEEAKLITQLAEKDAINYSLFEQAYDASLAISDLLDKYEVSKLLRGPYEMEGACVIINTGSGGNKSEVWAEQLLSMYIKWAKKQGYRGRVVEKNLSADGGIKSATIEFEFEYAYGFLSGERGVHCMISSQNGSVHNEVSSVSVDVVPLFLGTIPDLQISDEDLILSSTLLVGEKKTQTGYAVCVQHIPTALTFQSSGERSYFANQIKALNRLKAKLLVIANEQGASSPSSIQVDAIVDVWQKETRSYIFHPSKLVRDVKTSLELPDLNSVLDGNIEPLIAAHINTRQSNLTL